MEFQNLSGLISAPAYSNRRFIANRPSILIAEDDADVAEGLSILLGRRYNASIEYSGRGAIQSCEVAAPDLLIVDYELGDTNGVRLYECLEKRYGWVPPTIMLSAFPSRREACLIAGMHAFLEKPCPIEDLVFEIDRALHSITRF